MQKDQLRIGLRVRNNKEFAGIPTGSLGKIVEASNSWPNTESVAVEWDEYAFTDWFSFNDLKWLDVITDTKREFVVGDTVKILHPSDWAGVVGRIIRIDEKGTYRYTVLIASVNYRSVSVRYEEIELLHSFTSDKEPNALIQWLTV